MGICLYPLNLLISFSIIYFTIFYLQLHLEELLWSWNLKEEESYNKNIRVSLSYVFFFIGIACQGKDIVFRFIIEYSSLRDFGRKVIIIALF
jgi:hypothetical protein